MIRAEIVRVFVGENPSDTALRKGWAWEDGRLAAAQLFDGLRQCGIDPDEQMYVNLFGNDGQTVNRESVDMILALILDGAEVVGMGKKVQSALLDLEVKHRGIVHPAARGKIRRKENYAEMLEQNLG